MISQTTIVTNPNMKHIGRRTAMSRLFLLGRELVHTKKRLPRLEEIPVKESTIQYHFGSYEVFIAMLKTQPKRYRKCRECGKLLPADRFFFCNDTCTEKFMEHYIPEQLRRPEEEPEVERRLAAKCVNCSEPCKVFIPNGIDPRTFRIICGQEAEQQYTPGPTNKKE